MKKIPMIVAVIIATAAAARAEVTQINFDGRTTDAMTFSEAVKLIQEKSALVCHQECYRDDAGKVICKEVCIEPGKGAEGAFSAVPVPTPEQVATVNPAIEEKELNNSIGTVVKDCEKKGFAGLKAKFEKLRTEGTLQEKHDFVYNKTNFYDFPRRLFTGMEKTFTPQNTMEELLKIDKACLVWGHREECTTGQKEVCGNACDVGALVCMVVAGVAEPVCTVGPTVCHIACHYVPDTTCTTINYCEQEGSWPGMQPVN